MYFFNVNMNSIQIKPKLNLLIQSQLYAHQEA
jgi:hypothetical protein